MGMLNNMQRGKDLGLEVSKVPDITSAVMY